jgi:sugar O-acyltransferase (sialic acid O-acetyltransferase NeuD family)
VTKEPLLLVGAGGHARACIDVLELEGRFAVAGLVGLAHEVGTRILGYPVLGTDTDLPALLGNYAHALIAVGQIKTPDLRIRLFALLEQNSCRLPIIVSPRAYVSRHATLGAGTIVMHGAIVNAGAVVGRNCILNSHALIEHDAVVGDHCHIATSAAINSGVRIGTGTFVGSNSSVRQGTTIGERCLIGMGQRVLADCEAGTWMPSPRQPS